MPIDWTQVAISGAVGGIAGVIKQRRQRRGAEDRPGEPDHAERPNGEHDAPPAAVVTIR